MYGLLFQRKIAVLVLAMAVTCQFPNAVRAVGPEDAEEWKNNGDITVTVTSPADNTYRSINSGSLNLAASASDSDCYRVATTWYPYSDEVNSGDDASSYHIWWTKSGDGDLPDMYGGSGSYTAPGYSSGNNLRTVTISAHADDFNRSGDTYGYGDTAKQKNRTVKIWQVALSEMRTGDESSNFNGTSFDAASGGKKLGQLSWGDTVNVKSTGTTGICNLFGDGVQIKGVVSTDSNIPTSTFYWYQQMKGITKHSIDGSTWVTPYDENDANYVDDSVQPWDGNVDNDRDTRNTEAGGNPDVDEIFLRDPPGFNAGTDNKNTNWLMLYRDKTYKTHVKYGGNIVSNYIEWDHDLSISRATTGDTWSR